MMDSLTIDDGGLGPVRIPSRLRSKIDPEDIHQEAAVRVLTVASRSQEAGAVITSGYVKAARRTAILNAIRWFGCGARDVADEARLGETAASIAADHTSPSGRAMRRERLTRLAAALRTLPEAQRRAVELHHLEGRSLRETAEIMDRSVTAVAGLLQRGLKGLYQRLGDSCL
jgi:RNA polymerase sigma factor (sigma-70 family)